MTPATEILKLIENVQPDDVAMLDEIDARVCFFLFLEHIRNIGDERDFSSHEHYESWRKSRERNGDHIIQYTRSRDALKAIRPKEWRFSFTQHKNKWQAIATDLRTYVGSPELDTEELAELFVVIMTIDYERNNPAT